MRMLCRVNLPVERANASIKDGSLATKMQQILGDLKPEAAYFTADKGERAAYIIIDLPSAADIPRIAEPFFLTWNASVSFQPVMTPQDLMSAGPSIEQAVKAYG